MYHPYFRGKQFELLTVRECAGVFRESGFIPIIEPVKESLRGLQRCINEVAAAGASAIVVANPKYGDHAINPAEVQSLLEDGDHPESISPGILICESTELDDIDALFQAYEQRQLTLIHAGFKDARRLAERFDVQDARHVFIEDQAGKLYRRHFAGGNRVLVRDGFQKRANREHPDVEFFSDLHVTYQEEGVEGFGDFLIVGDEYSESGGPAYTVAIHLTFIDAERDDEMHIRHFKSLRQDTPTDPAGKFAEALQVLVDEIQSERNKILRSSAVEEFLRLHESGHFPGLGYVKKLSMKHHIETLAHYLA